MRQMSILDHTLFGLCEGCNSSDIYAYEIQVVVDDELGIPEHVKEQFGYGQSIILSLQSDQRPNPTYDYDSHILQWYTHFSQVPCAITIPLNNIVAIIDRSSGVAIRFLDLVQPELRNVGEEKPTQAAPEQKPAPKQKPKMQKIEIPEEIVITRKGNLTLLKGGKE